MKIFILNFTLILVCISNFQLFAAWEDLNPIYTGKVNSLAKNETYFFAATADSGIYRSKDTMHTWKKISTGLDQLEVMQLFANKTLLAAVSKSNGLYLSSDNANSWQKMVELGNEIMTISGDEDFLYVGTKSGLYVSEDKGKTWNLEFDKVVSNIKCIGNDVYLVVYGEKIYHSEKSNRNWQKRSNGITDSYIFDIDGNKDVLVICGDNDPGNIFTSTDNGLNWIKRSKDLGIEENFMWPMSGVVANDTAIYVYDIGGRFQISQDYGATWEQIANFSDKLDFITSLDNVLYKKIRQIPIIAFEPKDGNGEIYKQICLHNNYINQMLELENGRIIIYNNKEVKYSDNLNDWITVDIDETNPREIKKHQEELFALAHDKYIQYLWVLRSTDNGETWQKVNFQDSLKNADRLYFFENKIYTYSDIGYYLSTDNGETWSDWFTFPKHHILMDIKDNIIYLRKYDGKENLLYSSKDWGKTYETIAEYDKETNSFKILKSDNGILVLSHNESNFELKYKRDNAKDFINIEIDSTFNYNSIFEYRAGVLYIRSMSNYYYLVDGESELKTMPALDFKMYYGKIYLTDKHLYSFHNNAMFRFPLSELDLTSVEKIESTETQMHIYPNPSSKIFNLKIDNPSNQTYQYQFLDSKGTVLLSSESTQELLEINLSAFAKGSYFMYFKIGNQTQLQKLILE